MPNIEPDAWVNCSSERSWSSSAAFRHSRTFSTSMGSGSLTAVSYPRCRRNSRGTSSGSRRRSGSSARRSPATCAGSSREGLELRRLRRALALVGRRPRGVLGLDLGVLRRRVEQLRARCSADGAMPGAEWFPGAELSYAEHIFRDKPDDARGDPPRLRAARPRASGPGASCARRPRASRAGLRELGVERGDRVVAYMPNIPETIAAFLAVASASARSGRAARPTSAPARSSTASRRSSRRCCSPSTATATAARTSTAPS